MNRIPFAPEELPPSVELLCDALEAFEDGRLPDDPALEEVEHVLETLLPRIGSERRRRKALARFHEVRGTSRSDREAADRVEREGLAKADTLRQWVRQSRVPTRP